KINPGSYGSGSEILMSRDILAIMGRGHGEAQGSHGLRPGDAPRDPQRSHQLPPGDAPRDPQRSHQLPPGDAPRDPQRSHPRPPGGGPGDDTPRHASEPGGASEGGGRRPVRDEVDELVERWRAERPDLDVEPLQVLSRVSRLARHL